MTNYEKYKNKIGIDIYVGTKAVRMKYKQNGERRKNGI